MSNLQVQPQPELDDWQLEDAQRVLKWGSGILGHSMGLGKTAIALHCLREWDCQRILVICPILGFAVWEKEIRKWLSENDERNSHIFIGAGTKAKREKSIRQYLEVSGSTNREDRVFYITSYESAARDLERHRTLRDEWDFTSLRADCVIWDEAHRMKNQKTKRFKVMRGWKSPHKLLLTGTPMREGPQNLWTLLYMLNRSAFPSYWKFINRYCEINDGYWGKEIVGVKNVGELQSILYSSNAGCGYLVRREKQDVLKDLPKKRRQTINIQMEAKQSKMYNELVDELMLELGGEEGGKGFLLSPNHAVNMIRLRQLLVCPKLIDPYYEGVGSGFESVVEMFEDSGEKHGVVFTPFPSVSPYFQEYLDEKGIRMHLLRGGMDKESVTKTIDSFRRNGGILLISIKFAESYDLSFCSICWFLGREWAPDDNLQAEDRLHRRTSKSDVSVYIMQHSGTVDMDVLQKLWEKSTNVKRALNTREEVKDLLRGKPPTKFDQKVT